MDGHGVARSDGAACPRDEFLDAESGEGGRRRTCFGLRDLDDFDVEDEVGVGRNDTARAVGAVTHGGGDGEAVFAAFDEAEEALVPAFDHHARTDLDFDRFAALVTRIEDGAVGEAPRVVDGHGVARSHRLARARNEFFDAEFGKACRSRAGVGLDDLDDFDVENKIGVRRNDIARTVSAVAHGGGDGETVLAPFGETDEALVPALDHHADADGQFDRLAALVARVEDSTVGETARVMNGDRVARGDSQLGARRKFFDEKFGEGGHEESFCRFG